MKLKIKKGDRVKVITGSSKGKEGEVLELNAVKLKVKVSGVKVETHYDKKDGLKKAEGFIDYSNVALVEAAAKKEKKKSAKTKKKASKSA